MLLEKAMYNPVFFEMVSGSIAAERVAAAERQRSADAFAAGRSIRWTTRTTLLLHLLAGRVRMLTRRAAALPQPRIQPAADHAVGH